MFIDSRTGKGIPSMEFGPDPAILRDRVEVNEGQMKEFETVAIVYAGQRKGEILGSITWGIKVEEGKVTFLERTRSDTASATWVKAVDLWNVQAKGRPRSKQVPLPEFHNAKEF
jgi:hypothetical protein